MVTNDLMKELEVTLDNALYQDLTAGAFEKVPPYLQLYHFMVHTKVWPKLYLTAMECYDTGMLEAFKRYVEEHFPELPSYNLIRQVNNWSNNKRI